MADGLEWTMDRVTRQVVALTLFQGPGLIHFAILSKKSHTVQLTRFPFTRILPILSCKRVQNHQFYSPRIRFGLALQGWVTGPFRTEIPNIPFYRAHHAPPHPWLFPLPHSHRQGALSNTFADLREP